MLEAPLWCEGAAFNHLGEGGGDVPEFSRVEIDSCPSLLPSLLLRQHHGSVSCSNACMPFPSARQIPSAVFQFDRVSLSHLVQKSKGCPERFLGIWEKGTRKGMNRALSNKKLVSFFWGMGAIL